MATGHSADVLFAAFLPDGETIVTLGSDRAIILWDIDTGQMLRKHHHTGPNFCWQGLSPNALHAVVDVWWNRVAVINTWTGSEVRVFKDSSPKLAISHDGGMLACENETEIVISDLESAETLCRLNCGRKINPQSMIFSPDDRLLAVAPWSGRSEADGICIYEIASGVRVQTLSQPGHEELVSAEQMSVSPDGQILVTLATQEGMGVWDLQTGRLLIRIADRKIMAITFSPDGRTLLTAREDGTIREWDVATWRISRAWTAGDHWVRTVAQSSDGRYTLTGGNDRAVRLWDAQSSDLRMSMGGYEYAVNSVMFTSDGSTLVSTNSDGSVRSWDVATRTPISTAMAPEGRVSCLALSDDGLLIAVGNRGDEACCCGPSTAVDVRRTDTGELLNTFWLRDSSGAVEEASSAVFSPDSSTLAVGHWGFCVSLWSTDSGELVAKIRTRGDSVGTLAFSPDGRTLALGTHYDESVELFSTRTFKRQRTLVEHTNNVNSVAFSPDGKILATGSSDGTIKLWNPRNGRLLATLVILPCADGISEEWLAYTPEGFYTGSEKAEEFIRWEVDGVLHPGAEFAERFRRPSLRS